MVEYEEKGKVEKKLIKGELEEAPELKKKKGLDSGGFALILGLILGISAVLIKVTGPREFFGIGNPAGEYGMFFLGALVLSAILIAGGGLTTDVFKREEEVPTLQEEKFDVAEGRREDIGQVKEDEYMKR
mgnify:CR=1 FL=1